MCQCVHMKHYVFTIPCVGWWGTLVCLGQTWWNKNHIYTSACNVLLYMRLCSDPQHISFLKIHGCISYIHIPTFALPCYLQRTIKVTNCNTSKPLLPSFLYFSDEICVPYLDELGADSYHIRWDCIEMSACPSVCLPTCLPACVGVYVIVFMYLCQSVPSCLHVCLSVCLSVCPSAASSNARTSV